MTCIVGWANEKIMIVGGDSAGVSGLDLEVRKDPKVFKIKQKNGQDAIIGFTSSFRMGQLLMFVEIPEDESKQEDKDAHFRFLISKFIPIIRDLFRNGGFVKSVNDRENGGTFILAYRGTVYKISSDFQVGIPVTPFTAVGCGETYALGALHFAYKNSKKPNIKKIVENAILISEKCSAGVRSPVNIIEIILK